MKVQPNLYHISEVFEIHIRDSDWQAIHHVSEKYQLTYTASVRLCLFQLFNSPLLRVIELLELKTKINQKYKGYHEFSKETNHRHKLCLYGEDALQIRILAAKYGLTITGLVRLALELFLPQLDQKLANQDLDVVSHGIKIFEYARVKMGELDGDFHNQQLNFDRFKLKSYWPWTPFPFFGSG